MKIDKRILRIIEDEFEQAFSNIIEKIENLPESAEGDEDDTIPKSVPPTEEDASETDDKPEIIRKLPEGYEGTYLAALEIYKKEINHSRVARELGVSMSAARKYYKRLVNSGYLPKEQKELSKKEKEATTYRFVDKLSWAAISKKMNCSVTYVVRLVESALSKGYEPPADSK